MIAWLAAWLKEIILVVLFAVVTDMLLPNNAMQRYIKVVVSLFILLTILNPILTLLRSDDHLREVDAALGGWNRTQAAAKMASPDEIRAEAEKLKAANERMTVEWVEQRLAAMVKEELIEQGFVNVYDVQASVELNAKGQADVREVVVLMGSGDGSAAQRTGDQAFVHNPSSAMRPVEIETVKPVVIEIALDQKRTEAEDEARETDGRGFGSAETGEIRRHISDKWGIPPERIVFRQATR